MSCKNCNADIPESSKFCSKCGTKVETACTSCGHQLKADDKFCNECGEKINQGGVLKKDGRLHGREMMNYYCGNHAPNFQITKYKDKVYFTNNNTLYEMDEDGSNKVTIYKSEGYLDFDVNDNGIFVFEMFHSEKVKLVLIDFEFNHTTEKTIPCNLEITKYATYDYDVYYSLLNYELDYDYKHNDEHPLQYPKYQLMRTNLKSNLIDKLMEINGEIKKVWPAGNKIYVYYEEYQGDGIFVDRFVSINIENKAKEEFYLYYDTNNKGYEYKKLVCKDEAGYPIYHSLKRLIILNIDFSMNSVYTVNQEMEGIIYKRKITSNLMEQAAEKIFDSSNLKSQVSKIIDEIENDEDKRKDLLRKVDSRLIGFNSAFRIECFDGHNAIFHFQKWSHNHCFKFSYNFNTKQAIINFKNAEGYDSYAILIGDYSYYPSGINGFMRIKNEEGASVEFKNKWLT